MPARMSRRTFVDRTRAAVFLLAVHFAPVVAVFTGTSRSDWLAFAATYPVLAFSTGVALHRFFAHRSFATSRVMQFAMGVLACTVFVDPVRFAGKHRLHHRFSDARGDVHSPRDGLWFCWIWSLIDEGYTDADFIAEASDLMAFPELRWLHHTFAVPGLIAGAGFFALGGFSMLAIGYCLSVTIVVHQSSALNYCCHRWGYRRFETKDASRNNAVIALLTFGEGWHNNHHRFPRSARTGATRLEVDAFYWVIRLMAMLRLVWNIIEPPVDKTMLQTSRSSPGARLRSRDSK
jgi:stearoyl-CoA desaturase (delta-9 desaturase)